MKKLIDFLGKCVPGKKLMLPVFIVLAILYIGTATWYSSIPDFPRYSRITDKKSWQDGSHPPEIRLVPTLIELIDDELEHSWLPNDFLLSPTRVILDNRPNFQEGILVIIRHTTRILRDNLTRLRTTDEINADIGKAFSLVSNDHQQWIFPSFESRLEKTKRHLTRFHQDYNDNNPKASHIPRSDNLIQLIEQYVSELGNLNNKLLSMEIGFFESDNIFFKVQGTTYALYKILQAVEFDFHHVLIKKQAHGLLNETILRLQQCDFHPLLIVSGDRGSLLANHLIQMAGITADARQKLKSIIVMLDKN
ncbi:MAG: DUF2333 family protein [Bacteriovoracaceae bacterium]|nr:DUF2333 family protein [Bacteriovoracaceae bacterium]